MRSKPIETPNEQLYFCKECSKVVGRISNKQWIKSICSETDKTVRIFPATQEQIDTYYKIPKDH